ncbi:sigma factor-like helix-turn-helix DNA-binding protein [Vibrio splendidus]
MNFLEQIETLVIQVATSSFTKDVDRNIDIVKKRFGLGDEDLYTLQEIGDYYGITRERVRQIEAKSLANLRKVLNGDEIRKRLTAHDSTIMEFESLKLNIYEQDYILIESDVINYFCERYNVDADSLSLNVVPVILEVLGYDKLPSRISGYSEELVDCWFLTDMFDRKTIESVFRSLQKYSGKAEKVKIFDLIVKAKREYGEKLNRDILHLILKVCSNFQKVDENLIEVRFESLSSVAEKAYRVLEYYNEPKHYNDILREINFRLSKAGVERLVLDTNVKNQMVSDKRFVAIGKSGYWALKKWNIISTKSITELMELHFHKENMPQSIDQLFVYVSSKRPGVSRKSIITYLHDKPQFIRVGDGLYSLSTWGELSISRVRTDSNEVSVKVKDIVEEVFSKQEFISNAELISVIKSKSNISEATIRKTIQSCSEIEVVDTIGKSNKLKCTDLRLLSLSNRKSKKLLREKVQEKILSIMLERSGRKIQKIELYKLVSSEIECIRPTFYAYLSEMTNVKQYTSNNKYYCEMSVAEKSGHSIAYLDLSPLEICSDFEIVENVVKATDKLNEKDVDIGLFELGRIFESILKKYLLSSKGKEEFDIVNRDLNRLVSMISCVERNKNVIPITLKQHHLTLLREDRNLRAHDDIPTKNERLIILAKAPFIVEMYIDYIIKFSQLTMESSEI